MSEAALVGYLFLGEVVLLALVGAAVWLWLRRKPAAASPSGAEEALRLPEELADEARRYLQAELERTQRALELLDAADGERPALEARTRTLDAEIAAIGLAENPDEFWAHIRRAYEPRSRADAPPPAPASPAAAADEAPEAEAAPSAEAPPTDSTPPAEPDVVAETAPEEPAAAKAEKS